MGLDVYYYKMRQPKTEAEVKNALHENGVDDLMLYLGESSMRTSIKECYINFKNIVAVQIIETLRK